MLNKETPGNCKNRFLWTPHESISIIERYHFWQVVIVLFFKLILCEALEKSNSDRFEFKGVLNYGL